MPIKFTKDIKKLRALTFAERAKPRFFRFVNKFIKGEIISSLERGVSPVKKGGKDGSSGKLRYQKYSDSYKDAMGTGKLKGKKERPVNLKHTGALHKSIKAKVTANAVRVWFTDFKAKYHNSEGAGKSKIKRRLVPKTGEQWNSGIARKIAKALSNAIKLTK